MAVSKHNLWKRKKNGRMKLVRSHSDWLERRRERKMREFGRKRVDDYNMPVEDSQWWEKDKEMRKHDGLTGEESKTKPVVSAKRTQVGKKV